MEHKELRRNCVRRAHGSWYVRLAAPPLLPILRRSGVEVAEETTLEFRETDQGGTVRNRFPLCGLLALAVAACADSTAPVGRTTLAPVVELSASLSTQIVPNEYIVVLREDGGDVGAAADRARRAGGAVVAEWTAALRGYAVRGGPSVIGALRSDPAVEYVEPVQEYRTMATQSPATWGLDRIDQRNRPLDNSYSYTSTGSGVTVYIIDTGIRTSHVEFGGRASSGFDAVDGGSADDCNGHGTHVAGTVGGTTYGVAKGASLVAVRVLNCSGSGTTTGVISGINWVTNNKAAKSVANMSLGGGASSSLDNAVSNSIAAGVTYAVAAGNSRQDACRYSPARVPTAITVGATTSSDSRASYSNFGSCLDLFAPGSSITSAWHTSTTATNTISGTSMASPHVAGAAARYLSSSAGAGATPAGVASWLTSNATTGVVGSAGRNSPNRLLYMAPGS